MNDMQLKFYLPVPLNAGCQVTVKLPSQYSVDTITQVGSLQVFGFYREYTVASGSLIISKAENSF